MNRDNEGMTPARLERVTSKIWEDGYSSGRADGEEIGYRKGATVLSRGWFVITLVIWTVVGFVGGMSAPKWFPVVAYVLDLDVKELRYDTD